MLDLLLDCRLPIVRVKKQKILSGKTWTKRPIDQWSNPKFSGLDRRAEEFAGHCVAIKLGWHPEYKKFLGVLDIDDKTSEKKGSRSYAKLVEELGEFPATVTARSESGGTHFYFWSDVEIPKKIHVVECVDLLTKGIVYAPPSVFVEGGVDCPAYEWVTPPDPFAHEIGITDLSKGQKWMQWATGAGTNVHADDTVKESQSERPSPVADTNVNQLETIVNEICGYSEPILVSASKGDWRTQWVRLGMAINSELGAEGLDLFLDLSRRTPHYSSDEDCFRVYSSFKNGGGGAKISGIELKIFAERCARLEQGLPSYITPEEKKSFADFVAGSDFEEFLEELGEDEKPKKPKKPTQEEMENVIRNLPLEGVERIRWNVIKDSVEFGEETIEDTTLNKVLLKCRDIHVRGGHKDFENVALVNRVLDVMAAKNPYDPIDEYFKKCHAKYKAGNEKQHLKNLVQYLDCGDENFELFLKKWLYGVVEKYQNGFQNRVLILKGKEWTGKGTFSRSLFKNIKKYFHQKSIAVHEKDCFLMLPRFLCWDFEEFMTSVKDTNPLKAFITNDAITERKPYGLKEKKQKVICSFMGSTNDSDFLKDTTSSRRFFVVNFNPENASRKMSYMANEFDPDYLWGEIVNDIEVFNKEKAEGKHADVDSIAWLNQEQIDLTREVNELYRERSSIEELIRDTYTVGLAEDCILVDELRDLLKANYFFHGFGEAKRILLMLGTRKGVKVEVKKKKHAGTVKRAIYGIKKISS